MVFRYIAQMSKAKKAKIQQRLALIYAAIAWNGFAICLYTLYKKDREKSNLPIGLHEAAMTKDMEKVTIVRFSGLSRVGRHDYTKEAIEEARQVIRNEPKPEIDSEDF